MACTEEDFRYLRSIVLEHSFNALDPSRDYLFEPRLNSLVGLTGHASLDELISELRRRPNAAIQRAIAEAMTVNETSFFRDRVPFELMRFDLLPALIHQRATERRLRLWSAACSTGQEAYSLAMLLCEHFPQLSGWEVDIVGTDLSADAVARARTARYQRLEVNRGLPVRYLLKYMRPTGDEWEIIPELKAVCRFQQRNLCSLPLSFEKYDGILLRNVMLYFSPETRQQLLKHIHSILASDGFLILGSSEQAEAPQYFQPLQAHGGFYYKPAPAAS